MPAPTPFKDPDSAVATASPSKAKALTLNEQIKLKALLKGEVKIPKPTQAPVTVPAPRKYGKDEHRAGVQRLSQRLMDYLLEGDRLEQMMAESKLKDLGVLFGITTEKLLLMEGQPTSIIGQAEHKKMEEVLPALLKEIQRRGVRADLTERKVSLTVPAQ